MIRRGTENDIIKVSRLWLKMVNEMRPEWKPRLDWWRNNAKTFLHNGNYGFFIAEDGGKVIGFIDFFLFPEPSTGKIHGIGQHLYVEPEYRGNSVSGKLYRQAIKLGISKGVGVFEFFCFENEKSQWIKKGYKPIRVMVRREYV